MPTASLFELEAAGQHYCEDDWEKQKNQHHSIVDSDLLKYCFSSAYMVALLHDSLGIPMDEKRYVVKIWCYTLYISIRSDESTKNLTEML